MYSIYIYYKLNFVFLGENKHLHINMYKEMTYQFIFVFVFVSVCHGGIEHIDLNYTSAKVAYDELYMDGRTAFDKGNHKDAVIYFERAISDYRLELDVKAQCNIKCSESLKHTQSVYQTLFDGQLNFLHYSIKSSSCYTLCKEKFLGKRGRVARDIQVIFENREPYSFLQHSYFKVRKYIISNSVTLMTNPFSTVCQINKYICQINILWDSKWSIENQLNTDLEHADLIATEGINI